jgi:4-amino-4-deoxy-L-arabinose transferase-like glycosyltransferase
MNIIQKVLLALIIIIAFALRFYQVTSIPPSLNWDEVSIGYNAYSILKTGKDEWGQTFPVHFRSYGEYKLPAQIYFSIPAISIFGLNELGVRMTPVVYGTLTVLFLFFLVRLLFKNDYIGLISAFLLAISPWHIQLTRASFESSFALFWIVLGIWFLVKGFKDKKWIIISIIPFVLSMYTYNSARVFTPLFLIVILLIYHKTWLKLKKNVLLSIALFFALLIPLVPYYLSGEGNSRLKLVSITDDPGLIPRINENRGNSNLPEPLPKLIHNKITYTAFYFSQNYLSHFTPDFLFISGAPHKQHNVQGMGELYYFQAPFLLLGLYWLFKKKQPFKGLLLSWLLIAFIPVSITNDSIPHALRTLIAVPVYQILTAFGFVVFFKWLKQKNFNLTVLFSVTLILIIFISFGYYLWRYYIEYPKLYSRDWQYGYKQVVDYISENKDKYDEIIFTRHYGEPHMFTLFFSKYDPAKYQNDPNLIRFQAFDWVWVNRFDKYYFPNLDDTGTKFEDLIQTKKGKTLYIGKAGDFPENIPRLLSVDFLNGDKAFEIVEQ